MPAAADAHQLAECEAQEAAGAGERGHRRSDWLELTGRRARFL
jgi:hypothetical protein